MSILMLKNKRHAFPALARAQAIGDGAPAWGTRLIIDPKDPDVEAIEKAMLDAATLKWKEDGKAVLDMLKEDKKVCFERTPYRSKKNGKVYDGFEGMFHLGTRNPKNRPTAVDRTGAEITDLNEIERITYAGCYVNAKVEVFAYDSNGNKGISAKLKVVQFVKDGEAFSGSAPPNADDMPDLGVDDEEEALV